MSRLPRPVVVLSDVHLGHGVRAEVGRALAALIRAHDGHEIVLNGDSFDLSLDAADRAPAESVAALLREHREVADALASHLRQGGPVALLAGNHDAEVALPTVREAILGRLELSAKAPLATSPWIWRRDGVHVEHGHLYDPDNAPTHPLATWARATEPLGVALTRRFVARAGAHAFAHSHESTPLASFLRTFALYGLGAPEVVLRYFMTAFALTAEAGRQPGLAEERQRGASSIDAFAADHGLDPAALRRIVETGAEPTHHRAKQTFFRLYLDRSLATAGLTGAALCALAGASGAVGIGAVLAGYLGYSVTRGVNRYGGKLPSRLREAARGIAETLDARVVVFGHSHERDESAGYVNPGSFAFPSASARGYVFIHEHGDAEQRGWNSLQLA